MTDEGNLRYSNAPLRLNRQLGISTEWYEVDGRIRSVGDAAELTTESATVVLRQTINAEDAGLVTAGDQVRAGGRVVATVEEVATFATNNPTRQRVFVAVNLTTHRQQDDRRFGGRPVTRGQRVTVSTSEYTLKPGLTGLAQINDATSHEPERKLRYDIQYVREQSFGYDMMIVVRQIWIVLGNLIQIVFEEN